MLLTRGGGVVVPPEQIRIQPGLQNPKGTDKTERHKKEEKHHFPLSVWKDDKDGRGNTDDRRCRSFPRAEAWLFGWSWNGQDQRAWVQPTTSLTGCLAVTFQLWLEAVCCRHLMRVHVRVHKCGCLCAMFSGTSTIISLTVFFFSFFLSFPLPFFLFCY